MGNVQPCCNDKEPDQNDAVVSSPAGEGSVKFYTTAPALEKPSGDGSVAVGTEDGSGTAAKP